MLAMKNTLKSYLITKLKMFSLIFSLCTMLTGLVGCDSSSSQSVDLTIVVSVEVLPDDEPLISLSQEVQLQAVTTNAVGDEVSSSVAWTTSDASVLDVSGTGLITGVSGGTATITATAGDITGSVAIQVVDLTGTWVGGESPDMVTYTLTQTGTSVEGTFESLLGFPPITDVNTGVLTGSLEFDRYAHVLELTTETGCVLQISGNHFVELQGGELVLTPGTGTLSSTNCTISGTIDFATLERE